MTKKQKKVLVRICVSTVLLVVLHFLPEDFPRFADAGEDGLLQRFVRMLFYLVPYGIIGYDILRKAFRGILNRQVFDENFLMAVATLGALVIGLLKTGDFDEAVAVMLFYQVGELFQSYAVGKSRKNISALMDIRPDFARVESESGQEETDPEEVPVGSIIVVRPGEKVPLDGVVEDGESSLNTSALTGESVPRDVRPGDEIVSGCVNMSGLLRIRTTKEFGESTVSKILELVENASSLKSRSDLRRPGACGSAARRPWTVHGAGAGMGRMDLPGPDFPGHLLPLRPGHQHPADLLRRNRRRGQSRYPGEGFRLAGGTVPHRYGRI